MFEDPEEQSGIRLPTRREERRAVPRVALDVPVLVDSQRQWGTTHCRDVSLGGLSLQSEGDWSSGTVVDVYFELPSGGAVETRARVVALSPGRAHLSFITLGPKARAAVTAYVRLQTSPVARTLRQGAAIRPILRGLPQLHH